MWHYSKYPLDLAMIDLPWKLHAILPLWWANSIYYLISLHLEWPILFGLNRQQPWESKAFRVLVAICFSDYLIIKMAVNHLFSVTIKDKKAITVSSFTLRQLNKLNNVNHPSPNGKQWNQIHKSFRYVYNCLQLAIQI